MQSRSRDTITVLQVDDDPAFLDATVEMLTREDDRFTVETTTDAEGVPDRLRDGRFDCVVSDYDMPGMDGLELLETVRDCHPDLPFILYTGKGSETVAGNAISAGVTDYIQKAGADQHRLLADSIRDAVEQYRETTRVQREQTRQDEAFRRTRKRLEGALRATGTAVWTLDPETDEMVCYPEECPVLGIAIETAEDVFQRVSPDDRDQIHTAIQAAVEDGNRQRLELRTTDEDAADWFALQLEPETISGRATPIITALARDISQRKEYEQDLAQQRALITQAVDAIEDLFYFIDPDGRLERWNDRMTDVTGYDDEELDGMAAAELFPDDHQQRVAEAIETVRTSGSATLEADIRTASGERRPYEFTGRRLTDPDGEVMGVVGIGRDISERASRERKLTALHEVADELSASDSVEAVCERTIAASEEILTFDLSAINIENDGMLETVAVSDDVPPSGLKDMSVDEGIAGKTYRLGESYLIGDLSEYAEAKPQGPYQSAISIPVDDHGVFQASSEAAEAFDATDFELAKLLVSHAASALDRLERERQLQRQNERLDEFASVVSHDLRNPLNVAQSRLTLASDECDSEHLEAAKTAHQRMEDLIENLLALAREGGPIEDTESVSIASVAEDSWAHVHTKDAELVVADDKTIRADPGRLHQLFENLCRNAVEHGRADVTVTVGALPDGFYVADDGTGIGADDPESIFEMGYSTAEDGTGFGLSIVEEIVEAHGWEITATASADGGARFEITGVDS
ncbi:PAS domain-containing protein [Halovenus sp. WSH3]|uniref:histidine kinase n=1 Tax=Halovenus carboxidivorans TaxID=2692199 RepID=A0A6B0SYF5_9EURY|nr:PAS domain-containing protein [Halovenus carboxidivorans]MXR50395.1 PAS domain-containing protein [Halovenus carboxidivorans]